jgi:phosphoglycerate dehydrogenase-like enzyme
MNATSPIHVLISTRATAEQIARMRAAHPRLVIHGEAGGFAIMHASEVDYKGMDYPEERPDVDVEKLVKQAEVIIATRIPASLGDRATHLRWIQFTSAGVDALWRPFLDAGKIQITSAKGIHGIPMAEFVISAMLHVAKDWPRLMRQKAERRYEKFMCQELYGKLAVMVGVGEIGGMCALRAKQLGMRVIGVRRREGSADLLQGAFDDVVTFDRMGSALKQADYVVASLPSTTKTLGVLDEAFFRAMKPTAMFINVGRGKTVREAALVRALQEGWIAATALDVYEKEPLPQESPLWDLPNAFLSAHSASDTAHYMDRLTDILLDNLVRYAEGTKLRNLVDPVERY